MVMNQDDLQYILKRGILAPSGDNMQPWRFKVTESHEVELHVMASLAHPFFEAGKRTLYFSAGCVIENIRLSAAQKGYRLNPIYFPEASNPSWAALLCFEKDRSLKGDDSVIRRRRTNRKFYHWNHKVHPLILSQLSKAASEQDGFKLHWMAEGKSSYSRICQIVGEADQIRFENKAVFEELPPAFRFNHKGAEETKDGLDIRTMETGPAGPFLFKLLSSWKRLKLLNHFGMSLQFNLYARLQMMSSQACGLLVGPNYESLNFLKGGELMERIWHEITRLGLSLQPMESLPLFSLNLHLNRGKDFNETQRKKVTKLKEELFSIYGINQNQCPIFLFRMGYADSPSARSLRRPLESFLIAEPVKPDIKISEIALSGTD